ncbi:cell division protein FtsL [Dellaglioa sp. P0083]|uniref:cell division protein FtsL n=1 Tax=Dellaglioa kimchii TaxID=3344667 RepID=UPI0038D5188F
MAQNSTARQMPREYKENPRQQPIHKKTVGAQSVAFSRIEKSLFGLIGAISLVLMLMLVSSQVELSNSSQFLQNINSEITAIQTKSSDLTQEVNELASNDRLNSIANKNGLNLSESRIRNVTK